MNPYTLPASELEAILAEDAPCGDATTFALGFGAARGRLICAARYDMVVCGSEEAAAMGALLGLSVTGDVVESGTRLAAGERILELAGEASALFTVWKTSQTLMEYLSGIATRAAEIVEAAHRGDPSASVVCTRKNFPGIKSAAIKAVLAGGAAPHRLSLSETILIFGEHRAFLPAEPPEGVVASIRSRWPERAVVVEVGSEAEALAWGAAGADVVQLEKLSPEAVGRIRAQAPDLTIAAAGGVNAGNAEAYAAAGARILVTSAPYFAPPRDVSVSIEPA